MKKSKVPKSISHSKLKTVQLFSQVINTPETKRKYTSANRENNSFFKLAKHSCADDARVLLLVHTANALSSSHLSLSVCEAMSSIF